MRHAIFTLFGIIIMTLGSPRADAAVDADSDAAVRDLIARLADPDPARRDRAARELRRRGSAARPELIDAARGEHPAISAAAASILIALPWTTSADPMPMQIALRSYGRANPNDRIEVITDIAGKYPRPIANAILLRLICEEPSEDVCWRIMSILRRQLDERTVQQLRQIEPRHERASLLTMLGRAWFHVDVKRSHAMFRRAIDAELRRPAQDGGEMDVAFDALCGAARLEQRFDDAADLRRAQCARAATSESSVEPVLELFQLHALHGPLDGWERDVQDFSRLLGRAEVLYAHATMLSRGDDPLVAMTLLRLAGVSSMSSKSRMRVARFLPRLRQPALARRELRAAVADESRDSIIERLNARMMLAHLAVEEHDDAAAAEHYSAVSELIGAHRLQLNRTGPEGRAVQFELDKLETDILWHQFRAARNAGDASMADARLAALLKRKPTNSDVVLDLLPVLRELGRDAEAEQVFAHAYRAASEQLGDSPDDPHLMNQLAWLCARGERHLDRAVELSQRAIELSPANASYLDTAAEACFRAGRIDDAIRLEELALTLEPDYAFMHDQLARFRAAKAQSK